MQCLRVVVVATAALLVGCANGDATPTGEAAPPSTATVATTSTSTLPATSPTAQSTTPPTTEVVRGTIITTGPSEFGEVLFDETGQAIYLFDLEEPATPACYGQCAVDWPPVLTNGPPEAANEIEADLLGTTARDDGSTQVTYGGHPLYSYAHEGKHEVRCHDVAGYGGVWFALSPTGEPAPF